MLINDGLPPFNCFAHNATAELIQGNSVENLSAIGICGLTVDYNIFQLLSESSGLNIVQFRSKYLRVIPHLLQCGIRC